MRVHSNLTLMILLLVFLCQVLSLGKAFSVQYPNSYHPKSPAVNHHHLHGNSATQGHHHGSSQSEYRESVILFDGEVESAEPVAGDHEHANHSHMPSHPPVESQLTCCFFLYGTLSHDDFTYLNIGYAPPLPPPFY